MKRITAVFAICFLAVLASLSLGFGGIIAYAESVVEITSSQSGSVEYGDSVVLEAVVADVESYDEVTYIWLIGDTAGGWDEVGQGGKTLELMHTNESGDYKCKVICKKSGKDDAEFTSAGKNVRITPKLINVIIEDKTSQYGEEELALSYIVSPDEYICSDDLKIRLQREQGEEPGEYRIYGSSYNDDYLAVFSEGRYVIEKKPIEVLFSLVGSAVEDGTKTEVKVSITGILEGETLDYSISGETSQNAGRYVAFVQIAPSSHYSWDDAALAFSYTIYKKTLVAGGVVATFESGILPEAELKIEEEEADFTPANEEIIGAYSVHATYNGVAFDCGKMDILISDLEINDDAVYHVYQSYGEIYTELETQVEGGKLKAYGASSGKIVVTQTKVDSVPKIWEIVAISLGVVAVIAVIIVIIIKFKRKA